MANDERTAFSMTSEHPFPVRPQLRLHHLFAVTGVTAILLGIAGPQGTMFTDQAAIPLVQVLFIVWRVVYSVLAAIATTVVAYGIAWRRNGSRFFNQPGHWLLVDIAVMTLLGIAMQLWFRSATSGILSGDANSSPVIMLTFTILSFGGMIMRIVLNIFIGLKKCDSRLWSWVFYLKALAALIQFFGDVFVLVLVVTAAAVERRDQVPRDAAHWLGVALQIALTSLVLCVTALSMAAFGLGWWGT